MQATKFRMIAALAVGFTLSACATNPSPESPLATSGTPGAAISIGERDLTPQEKKAIVDAVSQSLRDPGSAKYKWTKFPLVVTEDSVNYCAIVDAKSPYPAYNGKQTYIVEAKIVGGHVTGAVMGLIAGGKDATIVANMCAKYGLDPNKAI